MKTQSTIITLGYKDLKENESITKRDGFITNGNWVFDLDYVNLGTSKAAETINAHDAIHLYHKKVKLDFPVDLKRIWDREVTDNVTHTFSKLDLSNGRVKNNKGFIVLFKAENGTTHGISPQYFNLIKNIDGISLHANEGYKYSPIRICINNKVIGLLMPMRQ